MDKFLHALACFIATIFLFLLLNDIPLAAKTAFLIGLLKEFFDLLGYGTPEWGDILANTGGVLLAWFFLFLLFG